MKVLEAGQRVDPEGEERGVRRDDRAGRGLDPQRDLRHAVGLVVIVAGVVFARCARLRDAPGDAMRVRKGALHLDTGIQSSRDERVGIVAHPQRGHQVFKHRARPGEQQELAEGIGVVAAELEPARLWNLVTSNGQERSNARFRGDHVVAGLVELLPTHVVADRENLAAGVGKKRELRLLSHALGLLRKVAQVAGQGAQIARGGGERRPKLLAHYAQGRVAGEFGPCAGQARIQFL